MQFGCPLQNTAGRKKGSCMATRQGPATSLQEALSVALASSEAAARRQDVAARLARSAEELLCASPAPSHASAADERSSDVWELARLRSRCESLAGENATLQEQVRRLTARVAEQDSHAQVRPTYQISFRLLRQLAPVLNPLTSRRVVQHPDASQMLDLPPS